MNFPNFPEDNESFNQWLKGQAESFFIEYNFELNCPVRIFRIVNQYYVARLGTILYKDFKWRSRFTRKGIEAYAFDTPFEAYKHYISSFINKPEKK